MNKKLVYHTLAWIITLGSVVGLILGATLIGWIVGDWVYIQTEDARLAWLTGGFVLSAFVVSLGVGSGVLLWLRSQKELVPPPERHIADSFETVITKATDIRRD